MYMVCLIVLIPTNMAVFVNLTKSLIARAAITGMPLLRPKWSKGRVHTCGLYNAEIYSSVGFLGRGSLLCNDSFPLKSEPYLTIPQTPKTRSWRRSHTRYHRTPRAQWKWAQQEADFLANYFLLWSSILNWNQSHISIPTSRPQK